MPCSWNVSIYILFRKKNTIVIGLGGLLIFTNRNNFIFSIVVHSIIWLLLEVYFFGLIMEHCLQSWWTTPWIFWSSFPRGARLFWSIYKLVGYKSFASPSTVNYKLLPFTSWLLCWAVSRIVGPYFPERVFAFSHVSSIKMTLSQSTIYLVAHKNMHRAKTTSLLSITIFLLSHFL